MTDNRQDDKIAELLAKAYTGAISSEEEVELKMWRESNPELYTTILNEENKRRRDRLIAEISVDAGWNKVKQRAGISMGRRRSVWRWTAVAASVFICLGVGALLFRIGDFVQKPEDVKFAGIETGTYKAMLITSGGQQIVLEDSTVTNISLESGIVATNDGKKVVYSTDRLHFSVNELQYNTVKVPRGGEYELILSDDTKVRLNSSTELRFPVVFGENSREVYLEGEAYFSVTKDEKRPFVVKVGKQISIEVLGTDFNVMAYSDDDQIETTLRRGKVRVSDAHDTLELMPDQQAIYDKKHDLLMSRHVDAEKYCAWKDGKFLFENASLESIMTRLGRWYNIHVFYQNSQAKDFHFTGDLERYDHFTETLKMLEKATNVRFQINENNVIVSVR